MKAAKILSVILCGAMAVSLTGCFGGSRISPDKLLSYAEDSGAIVYDDAEDYASFLYAAGKSKNASNLKKGTVISLEGKDIKTVFGSDRICILPIVKNFYDKDMTYAAVYCTGKFDSDERSGHIEYVYAIEFEDEDSADDYFEAFHNGIQPKASNKKAHNDDGKDGSMDYSVMNIIDDENSAGVGVYRDGNIVMIIVAYGKDNTKGLDVVDGICEEFNLHLISDT